MPKITEAVIKAVAALEDGDGVINPRNVVEHAKAKDSPLHPFFEWNIRKAAEQHWLSQAKSLIKEIRVVLTHTEHTVYVPAYVSEAGRRNSYMHIENVRSDADLRRATLVTELRRIQQQIERALNLARYFGIGEDIEVLYSMTTDLIQSIQAFETTKT